MSLMTLEEEGPEKELNDKLFDRTLMEFRIRIIECLIFLTEFGFDGQDRGSAERATEVHVIDSTLHENKGCQGFLSQKEITETRDKLSTDYLVEIMARGSKSL